MHKFTRLTALALLAAITAGSALAASVTITPQTQWVKTDVPADPSVTFGTLPNGMRYVIKHNAHPEHGVSFALRVSTGALQEKPKEAGIAHFIEHMAFRGTTHIADGDVIKMLQTVGVGFGTDSNATTGSDTTTYFFEFPNNDQKSLDTGFLLSREIASEVTFDAKAVDTERQVVLAEFRLRDTPHLRAGQTNMRALFGNALGTALYAIGTQETVGAASPDVLKAYYHANYRPERATLIVVGDIDPKTIEAEIKTRFAGWKGANSKIAPPKYEYPDPRKAPAITLFSEKGAPASIELAWVSPYDPTPETKARDRKDTIRSIALHVLNMRLRELATAANPPFLGAGGGAGNEMRLASMAVLQASVGTGDYATALTALRRTLLIALRDGVTQDEVDRAIVQQRTHVNATVTAAPSRKNGELMRSFISLADTNDVFDAPDNWIPTYEASVAGLTAAEVTADLRAIYAENAPAILVTSPEPIAGGEAAIAAAYAEGEKLPAPKADNGVKVSWPYTDFGPAGSVKTQKEIAEFGITTLQFANGVRATIKPTKYQEGQVAVRVRFGHGRFGLPKDKAVPSWAVSGALSGGGLVRLSNADLPKALTGKQASMSFGIGDEAFDLEGSTRTADLETELQYLTAFLTDPAWRPEGLQRTLSGSETALKQASTTASGAFGLQHSLIVHNGDKRWAVPDVESVKSTQLDAVKAVIDQARNKGPIEVVIAGDVAVNDTIEALKRTFGALAKREVDTKQQAGHEELPKDGMAPVVLRYSGPSKEALAQLAWKTTGLYPELKTTRALNVLRAVMRQRLFDELRTKEGITYSPSVGLSSSKATEDWGYFSASSQVPGDKISTFYAAVQKVVADLKEKEIPADEFERARGPLVKDAEHSEETNGWWLAVTSGLQTDPHGLEAIRDHVSGYKVLTPADVLKVAQTYLKEERSFRILSAPEGTEIPAKLP